MHKPLRFSHTRAAGNDYEIFSTDWSAGPHRLAKTYVKVSHDMIRIEAVSDSLSTSRKIGLRNMPARGTGDGAFLLMSVVIS